MSPIIVVPDATTTFNTVAPWTAALFTELLLVGLIAVGLVIGGMLLGYFVRSIPRGVSKLTGGGRRRRR